MRTWAREFRYAGSGRQRYLTRARDPQTLLDDKFRGDIIGSTRAMSDGDGSEFVGGR
ncbi:MAG: hypothetical protein L6R00_10575 [Phycisphaerae bacterium]|nr:hypothetical protein [Phycisphaerae bacterium]